jgi:hypothetical protein
MRNCGRRADPVVADAKLMNFDMLGPMKISKSILSFAAVAGFAFMAGTVIVGCRGTTKETTTTSTTEETAPSPATDASPGAPAPSPDVTQKSTDSTTTTTNSGAPGAGSSTTTERSTTEKSSN